MNLKILYDGPYYSTPKAGIARYFNKISSLLSNDNEIYFSRNIGSSKVININQPIFKHFRPHRVSFLIEKLWFRFFTKINFDIIHLVEYNLSPSANYFLKNGSKLVVTVHDLIHEQIGAPANLLDSNQRLNLYNQSSAIIFDSHATKIDFQHFYPSVNLNQKVHDVIWLGTFFQNQDKIITKKKHQFLFVGARNGYKNFNTAIKAFRIHCKAFDNSTLVVVGAPPTESELYEVSSFKSKVRWISNAPDNSLKDLYKESIGLLYLSNKEGFGLPLVESMSMGCVPIAGRHSSISEVLGDKGLFVDQKNPNEVANIMHKLYTNIDFRNKIIKIGYDRSELFTWEKTANKITSIYNSVLIN